METCESCKFFRTNNLSETKTHKTPAGNCKRYPPTVLVMVQGETVNEVRIKERNPVVRIDDWCGEFKGK